jgi:glycine cleavage system H protein
MRFVMTALSFTDSHEYVLIDNDDATLVRVGISAFAAEQLGDVVYVDLPGVGKQLMKGDVFGSIESVKTASDLYMPVSGRISGINQQLTDSPQLVNDDCYGLGWLIEIALEDPDELATLLTEVDYKAQINP